MLRHADLVHVSRHPEVFSSWAGSVVLEDLDPDQLELAPLLLVMDPPGHTAYRRPLAPHFGARVIGRMEGQVRNLCREVLAAAAAMGEVDLVRDVAGPLPARIIAGIMGLPARRPRIQRWAEAMVAGQDEEVAGDDPGDGLDRDGDVRDRAGRRPAGGGPHRPTEDITDLLLRTRFEDGEPMSDVDFGSFFVQLVTAGNDTTKAMMSAGVLELMRHPDQLAALRADPALVPDAVEEMLRYCNPLHYFRRTATADTELGGKQIRAGDKVALVYTSANRDEAVFADSQASTSAGRPTPTSASGSAPTSASAPTWPGWRPGCSSRSCWPPSRHHRAGRRAGPVRSNLANAYKRLPVRLVVPAAA